MRRLIGFVLLIALLFCAPVQADERAQPPAKAQSIQLAMVFAPSTARPMQSTIPSQVQKAFCGQCTDHEHCGTGNRCCRASCSGGKKTCINGVATCR